MSQPKAKILVVEDNVAMANVVRINLEMAGYAVTIASNGLEGARCVQNEQYQFVISDQQMPVMDGTQFCREMRKLESYRDVPTIMLTAKSLELELASLQEQLGIAALLPKPFSPSELVKVVNNLLAPTP